MMETKIQPEHKAKLAYIYLRQSTMGQVRLNKESTERQYALQHKAAILGWSESTIRTLDGDLGISGTQAENREDFKTLVTDVSFGKVGAVFALEASRLSRSCTDWHRLIELCALTSTLIIDEDGCYNPADFNDQLLLGLKGTMSQAELHSIRLRLLGGKINKAKKGELRCPLPVGYCYDKENRVNFDSDEQVRQTIQLVFETFRDFRSAYGVVHHFGKNKLQFPKRAYGGIWKGKLIWGTLSHSRVIGILKNPCYAGAYVYGRYKSQKKLSSDGKLQFSTSLLPMEDWEVLIKEHHEAYITWDEYLENQKILTENRTYSEMSILRGPAREGLALLQGLLLCGCCGRRLTVRYQNNGVIVPTYECNWKRREGLDTKACLYVQGELLDKALTQRALEVVQPAQIEIAIKAFEELERQNKAVARQWKMKLERSEYESQLAQRRYEEVDPANRLVASNLEKNWEASLSALEEVRKHYSDYQQNNSVQVSSQMKDEVVSLATNLPKLWNAPTTSFKDRKRILRLLIKDITVERSEDKKEAILHIRWQGGACEDLRVEMPRPSYERWRHPPELIERIKTLAQEKTDQQIVDILNQEKLKTNKENIFTISSIQWIRHKHHIPSVRLQRDGELPISGVSEKFGVSHHVVRYWVDRGILQARKIPGQYAKLWISIDDEKERELKKWVENSSRIAKIKTATLQKDIEGEAL